VFAIMSIRALAFASIFSLYGSIAPAQDPFKIAPHAYKLQFENEWVQVTRVHYGPHAKVPAHNHTRWPAAYVYLNDAGPIIFKHVGWDEPDLTRPPTKAGSFRLSPTLAVGETHSVENPNDTPSDFLRVEFKTQPLGRDLLRGRFERKSYQPGRNVRKVEFENGQIRVTRLICAPHRTVEIRTRTSQPALLVLLTPAQLKFIGAGSAAIQQTFEPGNTIWFAGGRREQLENSSNTPIELLMFDLRTAP
jgi:hypothetical protein